LIKSLVLDYLTRLKTLDRHPEKLALGLSDSKIMIWAEIEDDDEELEDQLLILEAKMNAIYNENGFYVNSTILEKSDRLPVPSHYQTIIS
jgi:hypothetical protein